MGKVVSWKVSQGKGYLRWVLRMSRSSKGNIPIFKIGKARALERLQASVWPPRSPQLHWVRMGLERWTGLRASKRVARGLMGGEKTFWRRGIEEWSFPGRAMQEGFAGRRNCLDKGQEAGLCPRRPCLLRTEGPSGEMGVPD